MKRRNFLKAAALTSGGFWLQFEGLLAGNLSGAKAFGAGESPRLVPMNAFLRISTSNEVMFRVTKHEMGQGVATGLAMVLAEELDVEWEAVKLEFGTADLTGFRDKGGHGTGGSTTIPSMWKLLRTMGASARAMLVQAAAQQWGIPPGQVRTEKGMLIHTVSGERLTYGQVAGMQTEWTVPEQVSLKNSADFGIIGKPVANKIIPDVVTGRHGYGIDVEVPGMLYALIMRCPVFRGRLKRYDASRALAVKGVKKVISTAAIAGVSGGMPYHIREGVAVLADSFWAARLGAEQLVVEWEEGKNGERATADLEAHLLQRSRQESQPTGYLGNPNAFAEVAAVNHIFSAEYAYPYQLHATMETLNCTAHYTPQQSELWLGTQGPEYIAGEVEKLLGIPPAQLKMHLLPSGGGFGRRYYPDVAIEALYLSRKAGGLPVKLLYTREQDFGQNMVHPYSFARYQAAITDEKTVHAWYVKELRTYTWGDTFPYRPELPWIGYPFPHIRFDFEHVEEESLLQSCAWRAVLANAWAFGQECFIDELAHHLRKDPYAFRRELLAEDQETDIGHSNKISTRRLRQVMELAVQKAGWDVHQESSTPQSQPESRAEGKGRGLAVYPYMHGNSYCAQVAEVTVTKERFSIDRIVCAVDCGRVVNPDLVRNQIEGGILWGLSALLYGNVAIRKGRVQPTNFHQNPIIRNAECPLIEVHFVESDEGPYGVGELSPPSAVPAVANAYFQATGRRIRKLPLSKPDEA